MGRADRGQLFGATHVPLYLGAGRRREITARTDSCRCRFSIVATRDNFLTKTAPPDPRIDVVVTNPPFGHGGRLACEFITRALALAPVVAMLLRVDFDSAKTRVHLFRDCPSFARKIILLDRITWFEREGAAGPSENHAWMIWNSRHRGPPTISYVRRP